MNIVKLFRKRDREIPEVVSNPHAELRHRILLLEETVHKLERSQGALIEEVEARIDRGNKIWRRIRRAQQSEESSADELESEESWREFPTGDAQGSQPEGMPPMQYSLEGVVGDFASWEEKKRAINRRLAGLE